MIANKEGSDIGYAIDIVSLKELWQEVPSKLFDNTPFEAPRKEEPKLLVVQKKHSLTKLFLQAKIAHLA